MEKMNKEVEYAMNEKNCATARDSHFPITKEDMKSILFGIACVLTAQLIRYAIYLPQ